MKRSLLATLVVMTGFIGALLLEWFVMDGGLMLGSSERNIKLKACVAAGAKDFDAVCRLADLGYYAAATEELQKVVANNPTASVPQELKYLSGNEPFAWREAHYWITSRAGVLSLVVVFLVAAWWVGHRTKRARLDIQDFNDGATDLKIGKGLAAMVEESLRQFGEQGDIQSLKIIAEPVESAPMPTDIKWVSSPLTILSQLMDKILPQRVVKLQGYVQSPGDRGAGLTLVLVDWKGKVKENVTLWQQDYDPMMVSSEANSPTPYYRLVQPTATWTYFQLRAHWGS